MPRRLVRQNPVRRQSGAYAIEFALVFALFFMVLYAILTYGFIFMAQQSLNRAANTGAHALLTWSTAPGDVDVASAEQAIASNTGWVSQMAGLAASGTGSVVQTSICLPAAPGSQVDPLGVCAAFDAAAQAGSGAGALSPAGALVVVRYDYRQAPLIPVLGMGAISLPVPVALQAQAQVDLGVRYPGQPEVQ